MNLIHYALLHCGGAHAKTANTTDLNHSGIQRLTVALISRAQARKAHNEEYIKIIQSFFKLAQNPKPIAFKIMLLMGACHKPQTHVRNLSYVGQVW